MTTRKDFTDDEIREIRRTGREYAALMLRAKEIMPKALAAKHNVSQSAIWHIQNYSNYRHVRD